MEYIEVRPETFDNMNSVDDLELVDDLSKRRKKRLEKKIASGKLKGRKLKKAKGLVAGTRQTFGGRLLGVATGGLSKLASKAGRAEIKKAGKGIKAVASTALILPVLPLIPMMKRSLKKKGLSAPRLPIDVLNSFYKNVVKKSKDGNHYEDIDLLDIPEDHIAPAIAAVVSAVITFVKAIRKKKQEGQQLTGLEETVAAGTEEAEKQIEAKAQEEAAQTVGTKLLFDRKTQFIIIGAIVGVIIIVVLIARKR